MRSNLPSPAGLPADIAEALALVGPRLGPFGAGLTWRAEVASTNDVASGLAEAGAPEGTVVLADMQTAGRGRERRFWASPAGAGVYLSVVLRPAAAAVPLLTITAGVAMAEGVLAATGLRVVLKWPNDLWTRDRKIGGILAEAGTAGGRVQHVVLGVGLNLRRAAYPPDVALLATSVEDELGRPVERGLVVAECLAALWSRYRSLADEGQAIVAAWRDFAAPMLGRPVEWEERTVVRRGTAESIDDSGALLVQTATGVARVTTGTVRWMVP
ncbi:MAG: biotin--[acetyl-CoA-carboxylase] ligase [Vicinamibacterales bacterium]